MYILSGNRKEIVNSEFVERFCVVVKDDAALIVASYSALRQPVTVARYADLREAVDALGQLMGALAGGQACFDMPESRLYANERFMRDARTKRKGGS